MDENPYQASSEPGHPSGAPQRDWLKLLATAAKVLFLGIILFVIAGYCLLKVVEILLT